MRCFYHRQFAYTIVLQSLHTVAQRLSYDDEWDAASSNFLTTQVLLLGAVAVTFPTTVALLLWHYIDIYISINVYSYNVR